MKRISSIFLAAVIGGVLAIGIYKLSENNKHGGLTFEERQKIHWASNSSKPIVSSAGCLDFTQAAAAVTPAVVYIRTTYTTSSSDRNPFLDDFFWDFFGQRSYPKHTPKMASGSGVIISPEGYIATNNHVVDKADKIEVVTNDKLTLQAKIIGTDPATDLALIKVNAKKDLPFTKLGNSDDVQVGEWVLAVGNPFNLTSTVTAGIISAKGRQIGILNNNDGEDDLFWGEHAPKLNSAIESFIQTDAAINPGNSGGALVNTKGELIGINAAIASKTGSYVGYGFAIPVNLAKKIMNDIEKFGSVKRAYLGISFVEINPTDQDDDRYHTREQIRKKVKELGFTKSSGLYISEVMPGGGAQEAGMRDGDIITKIDGKIASKSSDLQEKIARLYPGDKIKLTIWRKGHEKDVIVKLKDRYSSDKYAASRSTKKSIEEIYNKLGASFTPLSTADKNKHNITSGVIVTQVRPGKLFEAVNISVGTIVTHVNKKPVHNLQDIDEALTRNKNGRLIVEGIYPNGIRFAHTFEIESAR